MYDSKRNSLATRLPRVDANTARFIKNLRSRCKYHNVELLFINEEKVFWDSTDDLGSVGFFDGSFDDRAILAVSIAGPVKQWLPTLVHESCHMDQWIEDRAQWNVMGKALSNYFEWLGKRVELKDSVAVKYGREVQLLELDCENRSLRKIAEYKLNINVSEYIQKAATYIYSYNYVTKNRKWWTGVYKDPRIWKNAPKSLPYTLHKTPKELNKSFKKFLK